jgi:hypothetical protein
MNLDNPIVVNVDPILKRDGSFKTLPPITLNELKLLILDDVNKKTCSVRITPFPKPLLLWSGESYDTAGDYTQAQLEARVLEVLGNDPASVLKTLVPTNEMIVKSL